MILLAEHDEPTLAAKKKRQLGASSRPTSTPKNRVWGFENTPSGRPSAEPQLTQETATGSVQYTYQIASGRAEWLSRDPIAEKGGINLYNYVKNDSTNLTDKRGLCDDPNKCESERQAAFAADAALPGLQRAVTAAEHDVNKATFWLAFGVTNLVAARYAVTLAILAGGPFAALALAVALLYLAAAIAAVYEFGVELDDAKKQLADARTAYNQGIDDSRQADENLADCENDVNVPNPIFPSSPIFLN